MDMESKKQGKPLSMLFADDDRDDRFFFEKALREISINTILEIVEDGEKLMIYLKNDSKKLPDVLFLDLNMPRKSGSECLLEIKKDEKLKRLPVIIYSTSLHDDVASTLYKNGAHYYMRKTDLSELKKNLTKVLALLVDTNYARPERSEFIINAPML